jgi:hypothetical protein
VLVYHTDPDTADTDGDGRPDGQEILAGTDPLSPHDSFHFGVRPLSDGQLVLSWFAEPALAYRVEFSETLASPTWRPVEMISATVAGGFTQLTISKQQSSSGFYRLQTEAP